MQLYHSKEVVTSSPLPIIELIESCCSSETELHYVEMNVGYKLKNSFKNEKSTELQRAALYATSDLFQGVLYEKLTSRFPERTRKDFEHLSRSIAIELTSLTINKIAEETCVALQRAIQGEDSTALRDALNAGKATAKIICEDFYIFESEDGRRINFADYIARPYNLESACLSLSAQQGSATQSNIGYSLRDLSNSTLLGEFFLKVKEKYPEIDTETLLRDKKLFGAKGAHLIALKKASEELQPFLEEIGEGFTVPDFMLLPAHLSEKEASELSSLLEIRTAYEWVAGREVMIRSSAVLSEDGEHLGAGIYTSVLFPADGDYALFCAAVAHIHASTNTPHAQEYRAQCGITAAERMGVIIQEYVNKGYERSDGAGHINTVRPQMPEICDVVEQGRYLPEFKIGAPAEIQNLDSTLVPLHRDILLQQLVGTHSNDEAALILPTDHTREYSPHQCISLAKLGLMVEWYFKTPLQLEYVTADYRTHLVQARPLPETWTMRAAVTFPERTDFVWRGMSFGVLDATLDILSDDETNHTKSGIVIFDSGYRVSDYLGWLEKVLPKNGAALIMRPSEAMRGHIESRCAERGITVMTGEMIHELNSHEYRSELLDKLWTSYGKDCSSWFFATKHREPYILGPSEKLKQLRVVSNGLEARVYPVL
jgi:hypothetical protein